MALPIEADLFAAAYKVSADCAGFKEALAALASWQERKLVALLLRAAGTQVGVPERERDVLLREAERLERGMRFNTGRAYYLELLRETLTRDDTEFRQKILARLASNWTGRR